MDREVLLMAGGRKDCSVLAASSITLAVAVAFALQAIAKGNSLRTNHNYMYKYNDVQFCRIW